MHRVYVLMRWVTWQTTFCRSPNEVSECTGFFEKTAWTIELESREGRKVCVRRARKHVCIWKKEKIGNAQIVHNWWELEHARLQWYHQVGEHKRLQLTDPDGQDLVHTQFRTGFAIYVFSFASVLFLWSVESKEWSLSLISSCLHGTRKFINIKLFLAF